MAIKKKVLAGILTIALAISSISVMAYAEDNNNQLIDESGSYAIGDYWSERKAPIKEDYVFGGWYKEIGDAYEPLTANEAEETETAYAKFVPAYVLSVKAQNEAGVTADTDNTSVRIITSLDSKQYKKVGFDIWLANKKQLFKEDNTALETTRVYRGVMVGDTPKDANVLFGTASQYVGVWELTNIAKSNYNKIIYVRPYWITMDGTKVEGLSKYVRVMDGYTSHKYISVPVNLLTGDAVAAGKVQMEYDYKTLRYIGYDAGVLLPKMEVHVDESNGVIKFVGNATVGENSQYEEVEPESGIYANVWFQKKTDAEISNAGATIPERWKFFMSNLSFCDWNEKLLFLLAFLC